MPIDSNIQDLILKYCKKDLPGNLDWHINQFSFVELEELRNRLGRAFYSARYISKLMEALFVSGEELHPFVKFQIIQFASIYEAVISFLLWSKFADHPEVKALQTHKAYKPVAALGSLCKMTYDGLDLFTCVYKDTKTMRNSIPFQDKVDCAVRIGFVDETYTEDIKKLYNLRNLAHIENEAEKMIELELADAKKGYWRIKPFLERIRSFLSS